MQIIDFDEISAWGPLIDAAMAEILPSTTIADLKTANLEFIDDASKFILSRLDHVQVSNHLAYRLNAFYVRVYHGTRLSDVELNNVRSNGLKPLRLLDRRSALVSAFSGHPKWRETEKKLDDALIAYGSGARAGVREDGCIHVCFSRLDLLRGCGHYLAHGAEVDQHIAWSLFNDKSGVRCLTKSRQPYLITFLASFNDAAHAANPYGFPSDGLPSLVGLLFDAWASQKADPRFVLKGSPDCRAARFPSAIAASQIEAIINVDDTKLLLQ
jgi:hypothetical protein